MQATIWLHVVQFRAVWFGEVQILVLHTQIEDNLIYFSTKFKEKTLSCIRVNMVYITTL